MCASEWLPAGCARLAHRGYCIDHWLDVRDEWRQPAEGRRGEVGIPRGCFFAWCDGTVAARERRDRGGGAWSPWKGRSRRPTAATKTPYQAISTRSTVPRRKLRPPGIGETETPAPPIIHRRLPTLSGTRRGGTDRPQVRPPQYGLY